MNKNIKKFDNYFHIHHLSIFRIKNILYNEKENKGGILIMKGKHMKKKGRLHIKNESRFYALMAIILGLITIPLFAWINDGDITGSMFMILLGTLGYAGTFGEDK